NGADGNGFPGTALTSFSAFDNTTTDFRGGRVVVDPGGRIYFVGKVGSRVGILRYTPDGVLDPTFHPNATNPAASGLVVIDSLQPIDFNIGLALQQDGKIVIVSADNGELAVRRINSSGTPDDGTENDTTPGESFGPPDQGGQVDLSFHPANE